MTSRIAQTAAHLYDHAVPQMPVRQWVLALRIPIPVHNSGGEPVFVKVPAPTDEAHRTVRRLFGLPRRSASEEISEAGAAGTDGTTLSS